MKKLILMLMVAATITGCTKTETLPDNFSAQYTSVIQVNANGETKQLDGILYLTTNNGIVTFELKGNNSFVFTGSVTGSGKSTIETDNGIQVTGSANYGNDNCEISYTVTSVNNVLQRITATK